MMLSGVHHGAMSATPGQELRFQELAAAWLYTHRSWNTRAAYEADLAQFAEWCAATGHAPLRVGSPDIRRYRDESVASGTSPATVSRRLSALASFYDHALDGSAINPTTGVSRPTTATVERPAVELDAAETSSLLTVAALAGPKVTLLVGLLLLDGLKLGEVLHADVGDLVSPPPQLRLRGAGRHHSVKLSEISAAAAEEYLEGRTEGPLLCSETPGREGSRLTRYGADYLLKQCAQRAGLTKTVSANTLRRRYVARAHELGMTVGEIQVHVGHADRRTTRRLLPQVSQSQPQERSPRDVDSIRPLP